ncbi:MAG: hypothetical protein ABIH25_02180 [Candidatus Woesearchaeota archaeon]
MKDIQKKIIFYFCILVIILSLIMPVYFIYRSESVLLSTSRVSAIGVINVTVIEGCGNGACNAATETCGDTNVAPECNLDCGSCPAEEEPVTVIDGGSAGGGGGAMKITNFVFDPNIIDERLAQGDSITKTAKVKNIGGMSARVNLDVEDVESFVFIDRDYVSVKPGRSEEFNIDILISDNADPGIYIGSIVGEADGVKKNLEILLRIFEEDAPILVEVTILEDSKEIQPGEKVMAEVKITSKYNESVSVDIEYSIRNRDGKIYNSKSENVLLVSGETIFTQGLTVDNDLDSDYYFFYSVVNYDFNDYEDASIFSVEALEFPLLPMRDMIYGAIVLVLIVILIFVYIFRKKIFGIKLFSISMKKKKEKEKIDGRKIVTSTIHKLNKLKIDIKKGYSEKMIKEYFSIIRYFFSEYYSINYRFTFQELVNELNSRKLRNKRRVVSFVGLISDTSYHKTPISQAKLSNLVNQTIFIVKSLRGTNIKLKEKGKK